MANPVSIFGRAVHPHDWVPRGALACSRARAMPPIRIPACDRGKDVIRKLIIIGMCTMPWQRRWLDFSFDQLDFAS